MKRRDFLKTALGVATAAALPACVGTASAKTSLPDPEVNNLNDFAKAYAREVDAEFAHKSFIDGRIGNVHGFTFYTDPMDI